MPWIYQSSGSYVKREKSLADGRGAGGQQRRRRNRQRRQRGLHRRQHEGGAVGASGTSLASAYHSDGGPRASGAQRARRGSAIRRKSCRHCADRQPRLGGGRRHREGLRLLYDYNGVTEAFCRRPSMRGRRARSPARPRRARDVARLLPSRARRTPTRVAASPTNLGGLGGVGLALLYPDGASFGYVNADGVGHQGPNSVLAHTYASATTRPMTNLDGSCVLALHRSEHQTRKMRRASGCSP